MPKQLWLPEYLYRNGAFQTGGALSCDEKGIITDSDSAHDFGTPVKLLRRAVLPGLVNAHSHAFQRIIRGLTEYRTANQKDSFWSWREMMYAAAAKLTPEDVYDVSRMAFLEMALSGITCVGEFHYLHNGADGKPYDDPNLLARQVVRAASDVGIRIALLRVAYARAGFEKEPAPEQLRFIESDPQTYLENLDRLERNLKTSCASDAAWVGMAPHSVRAVPLPYLKEIVDVARSRKLRVHMHVAEQPAEVNDCIAEYKRSPVALLATEGLLDENFTAVHAIHVTEKAVAMLAEARTIVCACPTTERNLGDGVLPVDQFFKSGGEVCLGSDSNVQIDLLEDARELEYHLRLQKMERAILSGEQNEPRSALAMRLFECATTRGSRSLNSSGGDLDTDSAADFFTVDLDDPSIAGAPGDDLLATIVFSLARTAIKEVVVGGTTIVENGRHHDQEEIVERFKQLQKRLWS